MSASRRARLQLVAGAVLALCSVVVIAMDWSRPDRQAWTGLLGELRTGTSGTHVYVVTVLPLSSAARAHLRKGDRIVAVDDIRLGSSASVAEAARQLLPGKVMRLTVARGGASFTAELTPTQALRSPYLLVELSLRLITGLMFILVASFVYLRRPADQRAAVFYGMCLAFGIAQLMRAGPSHSYALAPGRSPFPVAVLVLAVALMFPLLLHFCVVFPERRPIMDRHPGILRWVYVLPGFNILAIGSLAIASYLFMNRGSRDIAGSSSVLQYPGRNGGSTPGHYLGISHCSRGNGVCCHRLLSFYLGPDSRLEVAVVE
jgi:hypothetical protein